ncbi:MAG: methyltransferase [Gammaproteobacteria bacterium]
MSLQKKDVPSPQAVLMRMARGFWAAKALQVVAELGIANLVAQESKSAEELSKVLGVDSDALYRLLRALASEGIFKEGRDSRFENTPFSEAIRDDVPGSVRDYVINAPHDGSMLAWMKFMDVVKTGKASFEDVNGCDDYEYYRRHPDIGERFNKQMTAMSSQITSALVKSYDFSQFKTLIDVGGGQGIVLASILGKNPQMHGCLYEQSSVIEGAKTFLETRGVINRCDLISGDFLESIPKGYDAYLLKHVLQDREDEKALTFLKNCRASIPKHGKLLIIEAVLSRDNAPHSAKWSDLHMMVTHQGGRQRTKHEFDNLLRKSGFELKQVIAPPIPDAIVEAVPI